MVGNSRANQTELRGKNSQGMKRKLYTDKGDTPSKKQLIRNIWARKI